MIDAPISSEEGYENVDIDQELPYLGVLDEFDEWLDSLYGDQFDNRHDSDPSH
jgi:hypothetical protein